MRTRGRAGLTGLLAAGSCALLVVGAQPSVAVAVTTDAKTYATGAAVGTSTMQATFSLSGTLGGLLNGLLSPIINNALSPLVAAMQGTASALLSAAMGSSSNYNAGTPTDQSTPAPTAFPADLPAGLPSPCSRTSATKPCFYGSGGAAISLPSFTLASFGSVAGYTQQVQATADSTSPIFGRSQVSNFSMSVLPLLFTVPSPIVSTGNVDSRSTCATAGSVAPTALVSANQVKMLNGAITVNVSSTGGISSVLVGTTSYTLDTLPSTPVAGFTLSKFTSSALKLTLPLSITALITALGLSGTAIDDLINSVLPNNTLALTVTAGPSVVMTAGTAQATGLSVGVDISGSMGFNLLGLIGATMTVPTGIGGGNLGNVLDARLGYSSCASGSSSTSGGCTGSCSTGGTGTTAIVPPALI